MVTATRGRAPWEAGTLVGVECVLGELDQGVEHPGAVVARVGLLIAARAVGVNRGHRLRSRREKRGAEDGAVLGAAVALDPDPAGAVVGDREEPAGVCGAFLALQGGFVGAFGAVGVDDVGEVAGGAGQVGGVEPTGFFEQHPLAVVAQGGAGGQGVDGVADDRGLGRGRLARAQCGEGLGALGDQLAGRGPPRVGRRGGSGRRGG